MCATQQFGNAQSNLRACLDAARARPVTALLAQLVSVVRAQASDAALVQGLGEFVATAESDQDMAALLKMTVITVAAAHNAADSPCAYRAPARAFCPCANHLGCTTRQ